MTASNKVALTYVYGRVKTATTETNAPARVAGQFAEYQGCAVRSVSSNRMRLTRPSGLTSAVGGVIIYYDPDNANDGGSQPSNGHIFAFGEYASSEYLRVAYDKANARWYLQILDPSSGGAFLTLADTFAAGAAKCLYVAWDTTTVYLAVDGGTIATTARTYNAWSAERDLVDVGQDSGANHLDAAYGAVVLLDGPISQTAWEVLAGLRDARPPAFGEAGVTPASLWYGADIVSMSLASGGTCIDLNDAAGGQILLQQLTGAGITQMNHRTTDSPLRNGQVLLSTKTQPRTMRADLIVLATSSLAEVNTLRRTVQRSLNPNRGEGVLTYAPAGERLYEIDALVAQSGAPFDEAIGQVGVKPRVPFLCNDPAWRDVVEQQDTEDSGGEGSDFPTDFPTDFLAGAQFTVTNEGDLDVWPVITIDGPVTDPFIKNVTTGRTFELTVSIADGYSVVIDMDARTVLRSDGENLMPYRTAESQMWALQPGDNTVEAGLGSASSLPVHFEVAHAPQFVGV